MNFYPFHIGDYASATRHLSWIEDAAYRRLIDCYYVREVPFPADKRQIYRLVVASSDEQRQAVDTILDEFFELTEEGYVHFRCESEIACANDKKGKASHSAQERWRIANEKKLANQSQSEGNANASENECDSNANASNEVCDGNAPNPNPNPNPNTKENQKQKTKTQPAGFAEFWAAYPNKVGKGDAERAWKKVSVDLQTILDGIENSRKFSPSWKNGYFRNPATWLNNRCWEDEFPKATVTDLPVKMLGGMRLGKNTV